VAGPAAAVARLREAVAPGSYLVISHADVPPAHVRRDAAAEPGRPRTGRSTPRAGIVPARTRSEIARFFGALTLVEPGLTGIWAWRPGGVTAVTTSDFMRILGGVARKD
jgi:S-adenosyl methyltransferase